MPDFVVKQGDKGLVITGQFLDTDDNPIDLTGATGVTCVIRQMTAANPMTSAAATVTGTISGTVKYTLTAADTANAGQYMIEFHATVGASTYTAPLTGYYELQVEENLKTAGGARIVGLSEAKTYLNIASDDKSQDAELLRFIDALTPVIENITGPVLQRVYTDEVYDGGNGIISLRNKPVISVQSVVEYVGPTAYPLTQVATANLGSTYSYTFEAPGSIVRRSAGGGQTSFPGGSGAVAISYTAGRAIVPPNIREGTLELLRVNYQRTQQQGRPAFGGSGSGGDDTISAGVVMGFFIPNRVRELLQPNKRYPSFA